MGEGMLRKTNTKYIVPQARKISKEQTTQLGADTSRLTNIQNLKGIHINIEMDNRYYVQNITKKNPTNWQGFLQTYKNKI